MRARQLITPRRSRWQRIALGWAVIEGLSAQSFWRLQGFSVPEILHEVKDSVQGCAERFFGDKHNLKAAAVQSPSDDVGHPIPSQAVHD